MQVYFDVLPDGYIQQTTLGSPPSTVYGTLVELDNSDPNVQQALFNPLAYRYENGQLTYVGYEPPASVTPLEQVQQQQLQLIQQGYNATIEAGFVSNASGQADTYQIDETASAKWAGILATVAAGIAPQTITVKDIQGNPVTMTQAQFKQFALDGFNFLNAQEQQLWALEAEINAATTIEEVQAITWTPGTYTPQPAPSSSSSNSSSTSPSA
ncbi:DUF4376 domain-containing protein [Alicyclobacillus vulcanalis]|uniref:DUF4376 domain-containing protein n=1 Tax=Alicyclobacillus vulcanalis TaxID=252246 RepID=A0A1N7MPV5_9BACL|nr:DUF4376 domain-containing protein [Alicyclobacillus vulcanalis]SIS88185.1 protein of unknown function [Alicyclobacillus vulcanalis]